MSPDIIGACRAAIFGMAFQIVCDLPRRVVGVVLLDQGG